jgi:hypothetical protein
MTARAALDVILADFGVRVIPTSRRRSAGDTHAGAVLQRILVEHGAGHLCGVLALLRGSARNREALHSESIAAVSDVLIARPDWQGSYERLVEAFECVNLERLRDRAVERRPWPVRCTLRVWIYAILRDRLGAADDVEMAA